MFRILIVSGLFGVFFLFIFYMVKKDGEARDLARELGVETRAIITHKHRVGGGAGKKGSEKARYYFYVEFEVDGEKKGTRCSVTKALFKKYVIRDRIRGHYHEGKFFPDRK